VNDHLLISFFDELTKIAADFKFLGSTAQNYAKTLKGIKAGAGSAVENAAYKAQNITKDMRYLKAQRPSPALVAASKPAQSPILAKIKARNAAKGGGGGAAPAQRYRSEGGGAFVNPITGRSQHILDQMKARVDPSKSSPQVAAAQKAEQQARAGTLQAAPKMRVL